MALGGLVQLPARSPNPYGEAISGAGNFLAQMIAGKQQEKRQAAEKDKDRQFTEKMAVRTSAVNMMNGLQKELKDVDAENMPRVINTMEQLAGVILPNVDSKSLVDSIVAGASIDRILAKQGVRLGEQAVEAGALDVTRKERELPSEGFTQKAETAKLKATAASTDAIRAGIPSSEAQKAKVTLDIARAGQADATAAYYTEFKSKLKSSEELKNMIAAQDINFRNDYKRLFGAELGMEKFLVSISEQKDKPLRGWTQEQADRYNYLRETYGLQGLIPEIVPSQKRDFLPFGDEFGGYKWGKVGFPSAVNTAEELNAEAAKYIGGGK